MPKNTPEQAQARRAHISAAAVRCFARNGFHETSMDDIIAESGLSAGAVYRYFPGKRALVENTIRQAVPVLTTVIDRLVSSNHLPGPADALGQTLQGVIEHASQHGQDLTRLGVHAWAEALREPHVASIVREGYTEVRSRVGDMAERWQHDGLIDSAASPEEVAQAWFALLLGSVVQRLLLGDVTADSMSRGLGALLGGGFPASPAIASPSSTAGGDGLPPM